MKEATYYRKLFYLRNIVESTVYFEYFIFVLELLRSFAFEMHKNVQSSHCNIIIMTL